MAQRTSNEIEGSSGTKGEPKDRAARIPTRHLSVRVPWHDAGWDGTVCRSPRQNTSCLALNRIGSTKDDAREDSYAGELLHRVPVAPPCFAERVNFLSPNAQRRLAHHGYSKTSEHHKHISDTPFLHPAFSAAARHSVGCSSSEPGVRSGRKARLMGNRSSNATASTHCRSMSLTNPSGFTNDRGFRDTEIKKHYSMPSLELCGHRRA